MGYFSDLNLKIKDDCTDLSYFGLSDQLLWRYNELNERYHELLDANTPYYTDEYFSTDDYRYASVKYFTSANDVYKAMKIAKQDLASKYGITVNDEETNDTYCDERDPNQIAIVEFILLAPWLHPLAAA